MCRDAGAEAVLKITVHTLHLAVSHPRLGYLPGTPGLSCSAGTPSTAAWQGRMGGPSHCPSAGANGRIGGP